jgi:Fuc2NAc and GlcNAc transferase
MTALASVAIAGGVLLAALWLTGRFRRYALNQRLLDLPNPRSSHAVATPRGGGMAIVLATLGGLTTAASLHILSWPFLWGVLGGGALVGGVGFVDDHRPLAPQWRFLGHLAAAAWVLTWLDGMPPVQILDRVVHLGWLGHGLAVLYLVWLINLTNFMDGIDGIAATEAVTVSGSGALLSLLLLPNDDQWTAPLILAAAALGFLAWNWPPARVFMGDAGSGFLGLMLGALSLHAARTAPPLLWAWIILLGVFTVDTTITLARRIFRGDRFYEAHRSHAYQHAVQRLGAHQPVTVAVALINLAWLLPLAALVVRGSLHGLVGVLIAYAPLTAVALWLGAGKAERSSAQLGATNV